LLPDRRPVESAGSEVLAFDLAAEFPISRDLSGTFGTVPRVRRDPLPVLLGGRAVCIRSELLLSEVLLVEKGSV
jgi:hypothetical protein